MKSRSFKLSDELDARLRKQKDASEFIREAIGEKLARLPVTDPMQVYEGIEELDAEVKVEKGRAQEIQDKIDALAPLADFYSHGKELVEKLNQPGFDLAGYDDGWFSIVKEVWQRVIGKETEWIYAIRYSHDRVRILSLGLGLLDKTGRVATGKDTESLSKALRELLEEKVAPNLRVLEADKVASRVCQGKIAEVERKIAEQRHQLIDEVKRKDSVQTTENSKKGDRS